jgi:ATP-binding cassette subfamily B protein
MVAPHHVSLLERRYQGENPFRTLMVLYSGDYWNLTQAVFLYIIKHSGVWAMPLLTANIIDIVSEPDRHKLVELWVYVGILGVIFLLNIPTHYLFIRRVSTATRNMETTLRAALAHRLQHLSMNFIHRRTTGALQTKLLRDVEILQQLTMSLFHIVPAATITLVFALVVTAIRAPQFLLFYLLTVPASVVVIKALRGTIQQRNRDFREQVEDMSSSLVEMIHLIPVTRAHGAESVELRRVEKKLNSVREAGVRLDSINAIFGATAWVAFRLAELLCLSVAAYGAYTGALPITAGEVVMLTGFFSNLTNAVLQITNMLPEITRGFESIYSIGEVLQSPDMEHNEGKTVVDSVSGQFRFEDVSFKYPDTNDHSLKNISLAVQPGEVIAFVGHSGAGKSTLLNLVIGFIRPSAGRVFLDGRDMNDLDLRTYRRYLSVVPQETVLFEGTVRQNICYGMRNIDDVRLLRALEDANAREFIEQLPLGLDTPIGENGARLSGGQRQRIAIARALIRDPRVLILDEATSSLDTKSEQQIQEALSRLMQNRTTFVVAHRLSTFQNADHIVVVENGVIVETGTHSELLARGKVYTRLYSVPVS